MQRSTMTSSKRRRPTPDQIIHKLAEGHKQLVSGKDLDEVCRHLEIAESTWHRSLVNRPVFCIRSGWVLGLDVGFGFERSDRVRTRRVGCRRVRCGGGGC